MINDKLILKQDVQLRFGHILGCPSSANIIKILCRHISFIHIFELRAGPISQPGFSHTNNS